MRGHDRGLRGWARRVNTAPGVGYRVAGFFTDAFGGRGGIALYARDFLAAVAAHPSCRELVVLPRTVQDSPGSLPGKLRYLTTASGSKARYLVECLRLQAAGRGVDAIVCGHINLLPIAALAKWWTRAPVLLCTYGIDVWER